jgi:hypothetical protein
MADGHFPSLVSRTRDANSASNVIFTQLADNGGNAVTVTGNKLDVNATVNLENSYVDDSAFTIGTDEVAASGYLADETAPDSVDEGDIGLARMTLDRKQLMVITDPTNDAYRLVIDSNGYITSNISGTVTVDCNSTDVTVDNAGGASAVNIQDGGNTITIDGTLTGITNDVNIADGGNSITVDASQLDIDDLNSTDDEVAIGDGTDTLAINTDGSINVNIVSSVITGEVHDYDTASAVASDATDNHDYATANTTFLLKSVIVSGSGNIKFEVQTGPIAGLSTVAVGFLTGRQGDTKQLFFDPPIEVPATGTGTTRIIRTNRQGAATDLYSTIIGLDI